MKISLQADLDIHSFSGSGITEYNSGMTNCVLHKADQSTTQRASIDVTEDGTAITALNDRGRGIYYWENNSKLYIIHDNDVYATSQDTAAVGAISAGTERVTLLETIGTPYLVILDAENDEGWYMNAAETVTQITDTDFPTTLCHGGVILDTYLHVMDEDGILYHSDVNNPVSWSPTAFVNSERENDKGVYLAKHHDHIVAFGTRTIEVFYNASNSTGSVLNRRQDVAYNTGCSSGLSVWEDGDVIFFMGTNPSGQMAVMKMENFRVKQVSPDTMSSYFTQALTVSGIKFQFSGFSMMGNRTLITTAYVLSGTNILPKISLFHDETTGQWGFIETAVNSHTTFPLMGWTKRTGGQNETVAARTGEGIFYNGDLITVNDRLIPVDTLLGYSVFEAGVFETGVFSQTLDVGSNIAIKIRTGLQDFDTQQGGGDKYKFQSKEALNAESATASQTVTIKHADENSSSFDSGRTVDISNDRKEIFAGGRFMKRNYQIQYSGDEQVFLKTIDVPVRYGR